MLGVTVSMEISCGALLKELQQCWAEIGESETDKSRMLSEIERECLQVYKRKLDEASTSKARLHQSLVAKEGELASLRASLGEQSFHSKTKTDRRSASLKEQLASVTPLLEDLRVKREERVKQFADIRSQIQKITCEITEDNNESDAIINLDDIEEYDLSVRKLNEYRTQLQDLQKEKSDRLQKVLEYVNEVHSFCGILGLDFAKTVDEVHPSLQEPSTGQSTNISNQTLEGLAQAVLKLKSEKKARVQKLRETVESLSALWKLMDSPEEEKRNFGRLKYILNATEDDIKYKGILSQEMIDQAEAEVERLTELKASRMKELVLKRRAELEEICQKAHMEPDMSTSPEKTNAMIDSGLVDPCELLGSIEEQIVKAKEECMSRKDIMDQISKWLAACEEENWLQEYNQDDKRYSAGRGAHLNLKRAEKARVIITKIPAMVDNLINRTFAWEDHWNKPFLYDGARLVSVLEEFKLRRQQEEEERRRYRDQKKLQELLKKEKEAATYGSKPIPRTSINSLNRKANGYHANGYRNGFMTPAPRPASLGSATPELLTPRSYSGRQNGYFKDTMRLSTGRRLNFSKEDTSSSFASISGSEPESPLG